MKSPAVKMTTLLGLLAVVCAAPAFAEAPAIGTVSVLDGTATRTPAGGKPAKLAVGAAVHLKDTVETKAPVKITLNDGSVIMIDKDSRLTFDEASFEDQSKSREGFSATLSFGKFWGKVKKAVAGSDAKFEVKTDRAVAGVRGTIFRVDATKIAASTRPPKKTQVWVRTGVVGVASTAKVKDKTPKPKGPRVEVAGPKEITKDEWEKRFAELQAGMSVTVTNELWSMDPVPEPKDAFASFVQQNDDFKE